METFFDACRRCLAPFRGRLWLTAAFAAGVSLSAVTLLGLSGWFLTAAAVAGAAGPIVAQAFNYLLPSAAIRFFAIARTALRYGERYLGHSAALRAMAKLRPEAFQRLSNINPDNSLDIGGGEAVTTFIQSVAAIETGLITRSQPFALGAGIAMALILTAWAGWGAVAVSTICLTIAALSVAWLMQRPHGDTASDATAALKSRLFELMPVLPEIRSFDLSDRLLAELRQHEANLKATHSHTFNAEAVATAVITAMTGVAMAAVAGASLHAPLANIALALLATSMVFETLMSLPRLLTHRREETEARARLNTLYDLPLAEPRIETPHPTFTWQSLSFALDKSLRLRIDGPSGSGKTLLAEALMGWRPRDGLTVSAGPRTFALCPQDATPLTGTIRGNLSIANDLRDDEMWEALDDADLKTRVTAMPRGLDTWVGDGGLTLSGGERKRLALARAYLRKADVLILDEPTEGLDASTEAYVIERLSNRLNAHGQGLILISHRLAPRILATEVIDA